MNCFYHHGIKGQKWGVRRFQKKEGTLTTAGKKRRIANEASNYYKQEADERKKYSMDRIHEIDDIFEKDRGRYLSDQEVRKLLLEQDALEMAFRHLYARSEEIDSMSKLGERYVQEYKKNVPIDKILKAYVDEYANYMYNVKGDKEWLLKWDDETGPNVD